MIHFFMGHSRTVLLLLMFLMVAGVVAFIAIAKESDPEIPIPYIYVSMVHDGISPADAERLLVKPMEKALKNIKGVKEIVSSAAQGYASVTLEFEAGFDAKEALQEARSQVELVKPKLPKNTESPVVNEINTALFPVLTLSLSAAMDERQLISIARQLKREIAALPNVLSVDMGGDREEVLEILIDPMLLESYALDYAEVVDVVTRNNLLVAAGTLDTGAGRMALKVPGVIESLDDLLTLPIKVSGSSVVTFADVASLRNTFKDPNGFARVDGVPAISLEVTKRAGANIIETVAQVQGVIQHARALMPAGVELSYILDQSAQISTLLGDLLNSILSAIFIVMVIVIAVLGVRSSLLVGFAIPGSFLIGLLLIYLAGLTVNIVVLFSLILVVGMLVDGAIVVVEMADKHLQQGASSKEAYIFAVQQMAWPIIASTLTTLAVFMPMAFWPGIVGEYMKYLPITVVLCLAASLVVSLLFLPVVGYLINRNKICVPAMRQPAPIRLTARYASMLATLLTHAGKTVVAIICLILTLMVTYTLNGGGVIFFPETEPETAMIQIHARGDLSVDEKDRYVQVVEAQVVGMEGLRSIYAHSFAQTDGDSKEDLIGVIQFRFADWHQRPSAQMLLNTLVQRTAGIPGIKLEMVEEGDGPSEGKPVEIELSGVMADELAMATAKLLTLMDDVGGFIRVEDSRSLPGIEWELVINRQEAARYGADLVTLGNATQLITSGINLAQYRPTYGEDEVDIQVRFPKEQRVLTQLEQLKIKTAQGMVPISNFVNILPVPKISHIRRVDSQQAITVRADVAEGLLVDDQIKQLQARIANTPFPKGVAVQFKGEDADQNESIAFLTHAFMVALFIMLLILVTQFNSLYQSVVVLSAIVFSTAGVLLGLYVSGQPFGIVMGGIGVIALAGIVVNNNIILIDAFNHKRRSGAAVFDAALSAGQERLRPVLLTSITTVAGLIPMAYGLNLDFVAHNIAIDAPSSQMWVQLATTIAGGLSFATVLTLFVTPCMLVLGERYLGKGSSR